MNAASARAKIVASVSLEPIVCLHASASSSRQWRSLGIALSDDPYCLVTPDLYGYGAAPPSPCPLAVEDEIELVLSAIEGKRPFHLIGHSYGGAVALQLALRVPERILSLTLFEPAAFSYLRFGETAAFDEAKQILGKMAQDVDAGKYVAAASQFINYWLGAQTFEQMPRHLQQTVVADMPKIGLERDVVFAKASHPNALATLTMPTLLLKGTQTPRAMHALMSLLHCALPAARLVELAGLNHMAPVTQPTVVNGQIRDFLVGLRPFSTQPTLKRETIRRPITNK